MEAEDVLLLAKLSIIWMETSIYSMVLPRMWNDEASSTQDVIGEERNLRDIEMKENDRDKDFPGQCIRENCNFVLQRHYFIETLFHKHLRERETLEYGSGEL